MDFEIDTNLLRDQVNEKLQQSIRQFYDDVPYAAHQKDASKIDLNYYKRHCIETILRIRHKRMIDALVTHHFTKHDPIQAKAWANYLEDEMLHGQMFGADLDRLFGLSMADIYTYEPLFATKLLNGYFYYTLEHEGPMAAIASAYFLEYTTRETQPVWLDNLEKCLGVDGVRGARMHVGYDIHEDHSLFVWEVLMSLVKSHADVEKLWVHLENIYGLFAAYFLEIYQTTIDDKTPELRKGIPSAAVVFSRSVGAEHAVAH